LKRQKEKNMHNALSTPLPASWLSSRLGVNLREIENLRERGELFAVRDRDEWLYPAWQFGPRRLCSVRRPERDQGGAGRRPRRGAPR
jgi:hypothetical protein